MNFFIKYIEVIFLNIKTDSRKIKAGDTFVALRGYGKDGHEYILDAIRKGASKVVVEEGLYDVETLVVKDTKEYLIKYLHDNYYEQIKDIELIGVTGTNGKTTTCFLIYEALNKLNIKCAYIGTVGFYLDKKVRDLNNTTPDILEIYELLLECKAKGYMHVVMEVSSHALAMKRTEGLLYDLAIFTNLTKEHQDYHKTMENYALAKQKLFYKLKENGKTIINNDDLYKDYFLKENSLTYGFSSSDYQITEYKTDGDITSFLVKHNNQINEFKMKLIGKHNIYNMLSVIIYLKIINIDIDKIKQIIASLDPPIGRMDKINYKDNMIIVDYAHTPDATENIISAVKSLNYNNIYTIIGCGGERDKEKRPLMGKIATDLSDYVILTSDNPRMEDPKQIIDDMIQNLDNKNYEIVINRKNAINKGIQKLVKNDILLILGKGHEKYQVIGKEKIDFDDKKIVLDIIRR